jgi:opacity protein-like surface antigen
MGLKFWWNAGLAVLIAAETGVAGAADLAVQAPVYKASPVILSDWAGFYVGVHGGYAWDHTSVDPPMLPTILQSDNAVLGNLDASPKGGLVGGHAGYNWQFGSVVAGVEGDYSAADLKTTGFAGSYSFIYTCGGPCPGVLTRSVNVDQLASARIRLGYTVLPNLLAYGTGGPGWSHSSFGGSASDVYIGTVSVSADASKFGWVVGAGLEYKLWDHVLVRAEYLHYDFGDITYNVPQLGNVNTSTSVDVARGGVSYKF